MDSNELRLNEEIAKTLKDLRVHSQERQPRNQQRRLKLPFELKNAMQDRQWKTTEIREDLESIRKFSILNCIRERVFDVLSELPLLSIEYLCQQDIDGLIRRNLLRERKVRFNADNEYEGEEKIPKSEKEIEKENILEEMDIVLKVLGNDKRNKLVIENFELLEERIARVEQRLSGLVRRLPVGKVSSEIIQSQIKIDVAHVRMDIENFVSKFNEVFSSDFEVPTGTLEFSQSAKHSISSTNRLKFQMLSRLPDMPTANALQDSCDAGEKDAQKETAAAAKNEENVAINALGVERKESKTNQSDLKAVDSLISLRERFKTQSTKWLQMTSGINSGNLKKEVEVQVEEIFLSKANTKKIFETEKPSENTEFIVDPPIEYQDRVGNSEAAPSIDPKVQEASERLKELNQLIKENKSVQTAPKKKKNSKSKSKKHKSQQVIDGKEVWVQYVNKKVLRFSKSSVAINESNKPNKDIKEPKVPKEKAKTEKQQKKLKQIKVIKPPVNINESKKLEQKEEPKNDVPLQTQELQNEQVTTQFKEYKKIFLLKIPKTTSKQECENPTKPDPAIPSKKSETLTAPVIKELPVQKKVTGKHSKTKSLIRLFPKAFKSKHKENKQAKEENSSKLTSKTESSSDSLSKLNTNQFLYRIRNRWIHAAEENVQQMQKKYEDWSQTPQNSVMKTRKSTQKLKKKKSESN